MVRAIDYTRRLLGMGRGRSAPAPVYEVVADGLIVTQTDATAWFHVATNNTDLASHGEIDQELDSVVRVIAPRIAGKDCHLKLVWSTSSGAQYEESVHGLYRSGDQTRWVRDRAAAIDEDAMPERHVFLGIVIAARAPRSTSAVESAAGAAFGLGERQVRDAELAGYLHEVHKLGRRLRSGSRLTVTAASAESLSWLLGRSQFRRGGAVPRQGTIQGASLAQLTRGRVVPYADHLRIYDGHGEVAAYQAVLPITDFPIQVDVAQDQSQWLRMLSDITRPSEDGDDVPVTVEASVRFTVLTRKEARKKIKGAHELTKEQRRSAAQGMAGDAGSAIEESELVTDELLQEMRDDGLFLVQSHPRLIVTEGSYDDLMSAIDAVTGFYANAGIDVSPGDEEQRDLFMEALPGDRIRVDDLGHIQDGPGFFGSLFWGGSALPQDGFALGYVSGSTPSPIRFHLISFAENRKATTVALLGRSGVGKSTGLSMMCLDAAFADAWVTLIDPKGDLGGIVTVAQEYGLPAALLTLDGSQQSGALDLFLSSLSPDEAAIQVANQLILLAPPTLRAYADQVALQFAQDMLAAAQAAGEQPSTYRIIEALVASESDAAHALGRNLRATADTPVGKLLMGRAERGSGSVLRTTPGIWNIQLPATSDPPVDTPVAEWDIMHRLGVAVQRSVLNHSLHVAGNRQMTGMRKVIAMPEVLRILAMRDGASFLNQSARVGRANNTHLVLDSQDATGIAGHEGLVEQLVAVFGFQLQSNTQQDALATMLRLPTDEQNIATTRARIGSLSVSHASGEDIKGDSIAWIDTAGSGPARVQFDLPNDHIRQLLDTSPVYDGDSATPASDELITEEEVLQP